VSQSTGDAADLGRTGHIDIDELADFTEGLVPADRTPAIRAHLSGCEQCQSDVDALSEVQQLLTELPAVPMPDEVFARLQGAVAEEQRVREADHSREQPGRGTPLIGTGKPPYVDDQGRPSVQGGGRFPKPSLGEHFTETLSPRRGLRARLAGGAAAAALLAVTLGFGGYLLSAASGTAEPPADRPIAVQNKAALASSAASAASADLDAYRFSRAWFCARKVTDGPISGIRSAVLLDQRGYLVFLKSGSTVRAVFVHGCETGNPQPGPTVSVRDR
jgi:anti-sigma factor RsiW